MAVEAACGAMQSSMVVVCCCCFKKCNTINLLVINGERELL